MVVAKIELPIIFGYSVPNDSEESNSQDKLSEESAWFKRKYLLEARKTKKNHTHIHTHWDVKHNFTLTRPEKAIATAL